MYSTSIKYSVHVVWIIVALGAVAFQHRPVNMHVAHVDEEKSGGEINRHENTPISALPRGVGPSYVHFRILLRLQFLLSQSPGD